MAGICDFPHHSQHRLSNSSHVVKRQASYKIFSPQCCITGLSIWHLPCRPRVGFETVLTERNHILGESWFLYSVVSQDWVYGPFLMGPCKFFKHF